MQFLLVFWNMLVFANCQGYWSPWADCTAQEKRPCYRKRDLLCNNGTTKGIQCVQGQGVFEQFLMPSCNGSTCNPDFVENTTEWNTKMETEVCDGECYDAERTDRQSCAQRNSRRCQFIHVTRCYNEANCSGIWKTVESDCSVSCGGGVKTLLKACVDNQTDQASYNCNGTDYGKMNQSIVSINCNNQPCPPSWTPWTNNEPCSVSCGGGIQNQSSMCIYNGSVSTLCDGELAVNRFRNESCNEADCESSTSLPTSNNSRHTKNNETTTRSMNISCNTQDCKNESIEQTCWSFTNWKIIPCNIGGVSIYIPILALAGVIIILLLVIVLIALKIRKNRKPTSYPPSQENSEKEISLILGKEQEESCLGFDDMKEPKNIYENEEVEKDEKCDKQNETDETFKTFQLTENKNEDLKEGNAKDIYANTNDSDDLNDKYTVVIPKKQRNTKREQSNAKDKNDENTNDSDGLNDKYTVVIPKQQRNTKREQNKTDVKQVGETSTQGKDKTKFPEASNTSNNSKEKRNSASDEIEEVVFTTVNREKN